MGKYLFEIPYDTNNEINTPPVGADIYKERVQDLKNLGCDRKMIKLYWEEKCLIHADCHCKSVFVKDGKTMVCTSIVLPHVGV